MLKVFGYGRIVKVEKEQKTSAKGNPYLSLKIRLAFSGRRKEDNTAFITGFYSVSADSKLPDYLEKGTPVVVLGTLVPVESENETFFVIYIDELKLAGGASKGGAGEETSNSDDDDAIADIEDIDF